ncbi:GNAT family N-acetyltransferase [Terricaulis sp.]|uniref:GNAT family N-acetyltransferase n=1 Tax=Terricaulis sp. TaxID=2768686 RepID=UPI003784AE87
MTLLAPTPSALRVRAVTDIQSFADIWPSLAAPGLSAHYIFQKRDLIAAWLATIGAARDTRPVFAAVDDADGRPFLLLGLGIERRHGARVLCFLDGGVCDYNAPILFGDFGRFGDPHTLWRRIVSALPPFDAVVFDKMPRDVIGLAADVSNPLAALAPHASPPSGHVVSLTGDWSSYVATRLHRPKDSRRKRRRLAEAGAVTFRVARSVTEAQAMLEILIRYKTRRYLELNGADGFDRPGYRRYFREVTGRLFGAGVVHVSALEIDGEPLALHWGLVADGRFYCLMLAHAQGPLAQYSPGRLLVERLVEWSYAAGLKAFDLGYGDAPWKAHFSPRRLPLLHAALPATPYGWAYIESRRLRDRVAHAATEHP